MTEGTNVLGRIMISPRAVATIAAQAALSSYGVVGMASRSLVNGIANALARDPRVGVVVRTSDDRIEIDLYVVVEYGTRISSVAASVANTVRYQLEKALGMPVGPITVNVQDLHVSNTD
ncbi:MAG TPA: Asp23/Gls24 family envelope stress response protein [Anaerolineales bacterium]|nr:Asp23/Gls24 family envelope stress response protein [Anaerolineales bacterium]